MPSFGSTSRNRLKDVDERLVRLFQAVVQGFDCTVIYGHRSVTEQQALYAQGRTKPGPIVTNCDGVHKKSMHNYLPSRAVDIVPYPVNWKDTDRMYYFAGYVKRVAEEMGIAIRWGGDWDSDTEVHDQTFMDLPHFELA